MHRAAGSARVSRLYVLMTMVKKNLKYLTSFKYFVVGSVIIGSVGRWVGGLVGRWLVG